jgi:outer membrane protein TolC
MKKSAFLLFALLSAWRAGAQQADSLDTYIAAALAANPGMQAAGWQTEAARLMAAGAGTWPDPRISAGVFTSPVETLMGLQRMRISVSQALPWPGLLQAQQDMAQAGVEAKSQEEALKARQIAKAVAEVWFPLAALKEQEALYRAQLPLAQAYRDLATEAFRQGKAPMADALLADLMRQELESALEVLEAQRRSSEAAFNALLHRPFGTPIALPDSLEWPQPSAGAFSRHGEEHPSVQRLRHLQTQAQSQEQAARFMARPQLMAGLEYMPLSPSNDMNMPNNGRDMFMPMVTASIPLAKRLYRSQREQAKAWQAYYQQAEAERLDELSGAHAQLAFAWEKAEAQWRLAQQQQQTLQEALPLMQASYAQSGMGFEALLRLQQRLLQLRLSAVQAKVQACAVLARMRYL